MFAPVESCVACEPQDVDNPAVAAVYEHWLERARGRWAPAWRDIEIMALPTPLLPYVIVCDVVEGGDLVYRYWGRGHTAYHNTDYTYKPLSVMSPDWVRELLRSQYGQVIEARKPLVFETRYFGVERPLYSTRLPLSNDGNDVTGIFGVAERSGVSEDLAKWVYANERSAG
ncbi:MAG: hypothetical protein ACFE0S_11250 [Rhodospirillales bacterium]